MPRSLFCFSFLLLCLGSFCRESFAESPFTVPEGLRPRVEFWKNIFTRYGEHHFVIHHRMYPQIAFRVVDLSREGKLLSDSQFTEYRKEQEQFHVESVRDALLSLADGQPARSSLEKNIAESMKFLKPTEEDYRTLSEGDLVRTQTGIKEQFGQAIIRAQRLLPAMEEIFRTAGLPIELTRIPFIESSFDTSATSLVGAAGIWQFMRPTARGYGLTVDGRVDQRRDPLASTRAAARYLKDAFRRLNSWPLAITSYNHGVGGVSQRLARFQSWDIVSIVEHPIHRPLGFASTNFYPEFLAAVEVYRDRSHYFSGITSASVPQILERVPAPPGRFKEAEDSPRRKAPVLVLKKVGTHKVKKGETLSGISERYGVSVFSIKSANALKSTSLKPGRVLRLPLPSTSRMSASSLARLGKKTPYKAKSLKKGIPRKNTSQKITKRSKKNQVKK